MGLRQKFAEACPVQTKGGYVLGSASLAAALAPKVGLVASFCDSLGVAGMLPNNVGLYVPLGLIATGAPFWFARGRTLYHVVPGEMKFEVLPASKRGRNVQRIVRFGDMLFDDIDLRTNFFVPGSNGSGKTSTVLLPGLEQFFTIFCDEEEFVNGEPNLHQKTGGLILEAKGEFWEYIVYFLYHTGRNPLEDLCVLRPICRLPAIKFKDEDTGNILFVNAQRCQSGSEAASLLKGVKVECDFGDAKKERIEITAETFEKKPDELDMIVAKLREVVVNAPADTHYVGWRQDNGELVRVSHTSKGGDPVKLLAKGGREIRIPIPKRLRVVDVTPFDNGLHYNIIDPRAEPLEAASKLVSVGKMLDGGQGGKKGDDVWDKFARKQTANAIKLFRATHPRVEGQKEVQCTGEDVYNLTALEAHAETALKLLGEIVASLKQQLAKEENQKKKHDIEIKLRDYGNLASYWTEEWRKTPDKTKQNIVQMVSNLFDEFVQDPNLLDSFGSPATYSFDQCIQEGKLFCFVPGRYEKMGRVLATLLKADFQAIFLRRMERPELNKTRFCIQLADECHQTFIGGSGEGKGGDPHFVSMSRSMGVSTWYATQSITMLETVASETSVTGFLGCVGGWICCQMDDEKTAEHASYICGVAKKEKRTTQGDKVMLSNMAAKEHKITQKVEMVEEPLYKPHDFLSLRVPKPRRPYGEAIIRNRGEDGRMDRVKKVKIPYSFLSGPVGSKIIAGVLRKYLRDSMEQAIWRNGEQSELDHVPGVEYAANEPATNTVAGSPPVGIKPATTNATDGAGTHREMSNGAPGGIPPTQGPKNEATPPGTQPPSGASQGSAGSGDRPTTRTPQAPAPLRRDTGELAGGEGPKEPSTGTAGEREGGPTVAETEDEARRFQNEYEKVENAFPELEIDDDNVAQHVRNAEALAPSPEESIIKQAAGPAGKTAGNPKTSRRSLLDPPYDKDPDLTKTHLPGGTRKMGESKEKAKEMSRAEPPPLSEADQGSLGGYRPF